ncbi:MAG TPA: carbohydrate porin [Gallionella sp.]|nr:carbohydrate porin [Gallionella sp.]
MFKRTLLGAALAVPLNCVAVTDAELQVIRDQIKELKESYEQRIAQLEQRLQQAEAQSLQVSTIAAEAHTDMPPASAPATAPAANAFNPAISLILSGTLGRLQRDPAIPATGFAMAANNPNYTRGFSLKESELGISANIDPYFRGVATIALAPAGGVSVENAYIQTIALGSGFNLKAGRFFSGLGYLNEQHAHAWDFVDQPLVYRVLWDNQLGEDGVQLKWLAPTDTFIEVGGEIGSGRGFPGSDRQKNGIGAGTLFAHVGGDIGTDHSWRAGVSLHQTRRINAVSTNVPDVPGTPGGVTDSFSGDSRTAGLDFVWKYAPNGNVREKNFKLQGEYFRRHENGLLTYNLATTDGYAVTQSGWYLQGIYQFVPRWRIGLRYDQLNPGVAAVGALNAANVIGNYGYLPKRSSAMLDYSPSEFSRLRLQFALDRSRQGLPDNQIFLQYIMSLGAHGAHQF